MIEINVLILEPHSVNRFRGKKGEGGVNCYTSHLYRHHWLCKTVETFFLSFPRKICNVNAQYFMNNLLKKSEYIYNNKKIKKNTTDDQIWELPLATKFYRLWIWHEFDNICIRHKNFSYFHLRPRLSFFTRKSNSSSWQYFKFYFPSETSLINFHWKKNKIVHSLIT